MKAVNINLQNVVSSLPLWNYVYNMFYYNKFEIKSDGCKCGMNNVSKNLCRF